MAKQTLQQRYEQLRKSIQDADILPEVIKKQRVLGELAAKLKSLPLDETYEGDVQDLNRRLDEGFAAVRAVVGAGQRGERAAVAGGKRQRAPRGSRQRVKFIRLAAMKNLGMKPAKGKLPAEKSAKLNAEIERISKLPEAALNEQLESVKGKPGRRK